MSRKRIFVLLLLATTILLSIWLIRLEPRQIAPSIKTQTQFIDQQLTTPQQPVKQNANQQSRRTSRTSVSFDPQHAAQQKSNEIRNYISLWRTPLLFFGKVIDENGKPIRGVTVSYTANSVDKTLTRDEYNQGIVTTDERGVFQIQGVRGVGLLLQLEHPNYYAYSSNRNGFDIRSRPSDGVMPESFEHAQIFRMHSKGKPVALIKRTGGLHAPADGTTISFPIRGKTRGEIIGEVKAQAWKGAPDPHENNRYDWKIKITVPGGGVLATTTEFDFVAPESSYEQTLEFEMSKDSADWNSNTNQKLFFKLPNYFVRGEIYIDLYHDFYFVMNYYVNPDGSRDLENDPTHPFIEP